MPSKLNLPELVEKYEKEIMESWIRNQLASINHRSDLMSDSDLKQQSLDFFKAFKDALRKGDMSDIAAPEWDKTRALLAGISIDRMKLGYTLSETATFILSIKQSLFPILQKELQKEPRGFLAEIWTITTLIDKLGLFTSETYIQSREKIIRRQQDEMMELSTPVVKIWDHILALPLIGTLDSARTQVVMENLLQEIVNTESYVAIIDITGVPTVDTLVAQYLMKTVAAARLMGAECIVSGIRPQIAQTMVHLGVSFSDIVTKATLADAIRHAFMKMGIRIDRSLESA